MHPICFLLNGITVKLEVRDMTGAITSKGNREGHPCKHYIFLFQKAASRNDIKWIWDKKDK
jgi:hypothetical protein